MSSGIVIVVAEFRIMDGFGINGDILSMFGWHVEKAVNVNTIMALSHEGWFWWMSCSAYHTSDMWSGAARMRGMWVLLEYIHMQNAHVGTTTANENAITFRWIHLNSYTNYLTALRFDLSWDVGAVCRMQAKLIGPMKRTNLCHFFVPISNHAPFTRYLRWFFCFFRMSTRFSSSKMPKFGT